MKKRLRVGNKEGEEELLEKIVGICKREIVNKSRMYRITRERERERGRTTFVRLSHTGNLEQAESTQNYCWNLTHTHFLHEG